MMNPKSLTIETNNMSIQEIITKINNKYDTMERYKYRFTPKFDMTRQYQYTKLYREHEDDIIRHMLDNWRQLETLSFKTFTKSNTINTDLQDLLLESVYECFKDEKECLSDAEIESKLAVKLVKNFDKLIFMRTANTSTAYGFI